MNVLLATLSSRNPNEMKFESRTDLYMHNRHSGTSSKPVSSLFKLKFGFFFADHTFFGRDSNRSGIIDGRTVRFT